MTDKHYPFLDALARKPVEYTPIWIMRQAGRYLPEYRQLRQKVKDFLTLCKTPELACEVTLQPLKRFPLDASIIFSDILTIPDAMGLELSFEANEGPRFAKPIKDENDIIRLPTLDIEQDLGYVMEAIKLTRHELAGKVPLIGFSGSPWTLAVYMIEGGSSKNFHRVKQFMYTKSVAFSLLIDKLVNSITQYLKAQINAGVQAVMLFDSWGGILTPESYQRFSLNPMINIIQNIKAEYPTIPIILFTKNGGLWLANIVESGADALGLDWTINIATARQQVQGRVALQGNMDPAILYGSANLIRSEVDKILNDYGPYPGHIFNLGHGIHPDIPIENVAILIDAVHELSRKFHSSKTL